MRCLQRHGRLPDCVSPSWLSFYLMQHRLCYSGPERTPTASSSSLREQSMSGSEVYEAFQASVAARTVGNSSLRKYVQNCSPQDINKVEAAINGAKSGGLRIDAKTTEVFLEKLVASGRLKQAMDVFTKMKSDHITPTSNTYNILMKLCLDKDMASSVVTLFDEMQKRGAAPTLDSYEYVITSLAMENPPKWEKAVEIFDKVTRDRNNKVTAKTYNALMRVYMNMTPFDWRVVYNCYYELRQQHPAIPLTWESYALVTEALKKGRAGRIRQCMTFVDAWFTMTHLRSVEFATGMGLFISSIMVLKILLGWLVTRWKGGFDSARKKQSESVVTAF